MDASWLSGELSNQKATRWCATVGVSTTCFWASPLLAMLTYWGSDVFGLQSYLILLLKLLNEDWIQRPLNQDHWLFIAVHCDSMLKCWMFLHWYSSTTAWSTYNSDHWHTANKARTHRESWELSCVFNVYNIFCVKLCCSLLVILTYTIMFDSWRLCRLNSREQIVRPQIRLFNGLLTVVDE